GRQSNTEIRIECQAENAEAGTAWLKHAMQGGMVPLLRPAPVEIATTIAPTWGGAGAGRNGLPDVGVLAGATPGGVRPLRRGSQDDAAPRPRLEVERADPGAGTAAGAACATPAMGSGRRVASPVVGV